MNRVFTNPMLRGIAGLLPPMAVVQHVGRRSGKMYRTPVFAFRRDGELVIVLSYGRQSDWVLNVLAAGGATVRRSGRTTPVGQPSVVGMADRGQLSPLGRFSCRFADDVMIVRSIRPD